MAALNRCHFHMPGMCREIASPVARQVPSERGAVLHGSGALPDLCKPLLSPSLELNPPKPCEPSFPLQHSKTPQTPNLSKFIGIEGSSQGD